MNSLRVGTRGSLLALTQTRKVVAELIAAHPGLVVEEVIIQTEGDTTTTPLSEAKAPGVFVSALRDALLEDRVDFLVHSLKDLPALPMPGIVTAAIPEREDNRDVLVSRGGLKLADLPRGATVGTSSPRRTAILRRLRPDLIIESIRGNIDSRIYKVDSGQYDATVLALAGLKRIDRTDAISDFLDDEVFIPAPGQGALSIECRETDTEIVDLLAVLDHSETRICVSAERSVLVGLSAGCATAIGAKATLNGKQLSLKAELAVEETGESVAVELSTKLPKQPALRASELGLDAAARLLASPIAKLAAFK